MTGDAAGLADAAERFRSMSMPFWLAVTQVEQAEALGAGARRRRCSARRARRSSGSARRRGSSGPALRLAKVAV